MERSERLAPEGPEAEARHATIVKCDLVGSTQTKKPLDLDGMLELQRGCEQIIVDVATRFGAYIERFEGDGALVVFGFPQPMEDAAELAVRAGLALVDAVRTAEIVPNVRLQLRVGIASGLIAVVKRRSNLKSEPIAGITIDMAERLRARADPDQVVVADSTKRLAGSLFHYADLGTLPSKGFEEGLRAWRVVGPSPVVSRFEAQRFDPSRGEIIGRGEVLALLSQAWEATRGGNGRAICLLGDAGIGKSRLARAALDAAIGDGAATLRIDCTPSTGNTPLFPIGVMMRRATRIASETAEPDKRALVERLLRRSLPDDAVPAALTYLAPLFGLEGVEIPTKVGPAEVREQTISTLVRIFNSVVSERPLVVLCEDLHWVDDSTAKVLDRVCADVGRRHALIIVTMRPSAEGPPLDLSPFTTVALQPLDPSTAADLVHSVAKEQALPDEVVRQIVDRCEGVPLVLEEVTRNALEAATRPDDAAPAPFADSAVPAPLQLVVQSRLNRRPRFAPVVQSAAVLGRDFSVKLLERIVTTDRGSDVYDTITMLARDGLFAEPGAAQPERGRFKHAMICDAVYNTLLGSDRRRLHSLIADILSQDYKGTPDAAADVVAEHLRKAGRFIEAIRVRLAESAQTAARGAYVETEGHCLAALALIDELRDSAERTALQFRLLIQLGVALTGQHGYSAAVVEDAYRRAHAVCGDRAEAEMLYPIMRGLATVNLVRGDLPTAHELSEQGLQLAQQSKRVEFIIDAMSVLCYTTLYYGRLEDCRAWIDRCLQLYRAVQGHTLTYPVPQDAATAVMAVLPTVAWLLGDAHAAEEAVREGLAHVDRLNADFDRALLHSWIAGARYTQRRYAEALEHAGIAINISQRHGYREWHGTGALMALLAQSALQANPEAAAQATAACTQFAREGVGLNASYYLWGLARGHAQAGDVQTASQMLAEAFRRAAASQETRMNAELLIFQAEMEADDVQAAGLLRTAYGLAQQQGAIATGLRAAATLALRSDADDACAALARAALDALDGRSVYPAERDWMRQRSTALWRMLDARDAAMVQA